MFGAFAGAGLNAILARTVGALVAGEDRCLCGRAPAGALDRLPGRDRRPRRPAGDRGHSSGRRLDTAVSAHDARDHAGAAHPELSPHHSGAAHVRRRDGGLRAVASLALRPRPALRSVQSGERDRAARLSADRRGGVGRTDRAGFDLDGRRHQPFGLGALERPPPPRLRHRRPRRRAFLHPVQAQHLPAGLDGGVSRSGCSRIVPCSGATARSPRFSSCFLPSPRRR